MLINMNGGEVKLWKGLHGLPNKMLPVGYVMGATGERNTKYGMQDYLDVVQVDWDGNIVWKFNEYEYPAWHRIIHRQPETASRFTMVK